METMTKTHYKENEAIKHLQVALKRTFMGMTFLTCEIQDLEKSVEEKSFNTTPR